MAGTNIETSRPFYVYEIYDESGIVIYVGKGVKDRVNKSQKERGGHSSKIVKRFQYELDSFDYEKVLIAKHKNLLNKTAGGDGGRVGKTKDVLLIDKIGTKAYAARMLLNYHKAFKLLSSKVDDYYSKDLQEQFNKFNIPLLTEIAYGERQKNGW